MYLDTNAYAKRMLLNPGTVRRQCASGEIPGAVKAGSRWRIWVEGEDPAPEPEQPAEKATFPECIYIVGTGSRPHVAAVAYRDFSDAAAHARQVHGDASDGDPREYIAELVLVPGNGGA